MYDFRLGDLAFPSKYDLLFKFYTEPNGFSSKESRNFNGEAKIFFQVRQPTNRIRLHVDIELVVKRQDITLINSDTNQEINIVQSSYLPNQLFEILTERELDATNFFIILKFSGKTKNAGMYQANYWENFLPRELIVTNFLPTNARSVL